MHSLLYLLPFAFHLQISGSTPTTKTRMEIFLTLILHSIRFSDKGNVSLSDRYRPFYWVNWWMCLSFNSCENLRAVKNSGSRATGSTLVSQLIDSFVVLFIAFYGVFTTEQIIAIGITNYIYKFAVAILLTPLIYFGHALIDKYLGKEQAEKISSEAAKDSEGFF